MNENINNGLGGSAKQLWWVIGLLTTIILSAAGHTINSVQRDGERIAILETQNIDIRETLKRISDKIDALLENRRK